MAVTRTIFLKDKNFFNTQFVKGLQIWIIRIALLILLIRTNSKFLEVDKQYSPSIPFIIDKMWLSIKPNFEKKTLTDCIQQLLITAKENIKEIRLDIAELKIHKILLLPSSLVYPSSSYSISDISIDSRDDDEVNEVIGIKNSMY